MVMLIMIGLIAVSCMTMMSSIASPYGGRHAIVQETEKSEPDRCYTSIHIREGDTLDSIAAQFNDGTYYSDAEYIETIKMINGIAHEDIHPGCYLIVMSLR